MKLIIKHLLSLFVLIGLLELSACSNNGVAKYDPNSSGSYSTIISNPISPVPLSNGGTTEFYVYVYNGTVVEANNLSWKVTSSANSSNASLTSNIKSWFKSLWSSKASPTQASPDSITIVDSTGCNTIPSGYSCRILLSANSPGAALLEGSNRDGAVVVSEIPSSYSYTTTNGTSSNSLVLSPLSPLVTLQNGLGAANFFVINNSSSLIDITNLLGNLPNGVIPITI